MIETALGPFSQQTMIVGQQIQAQLEQLPHPERFSLLLWLNAQLLSRPEEPYFLELLKELREAEAKRTYRFNSEQRELFRNLLAKIEQTTEPTFGLFAGIDAKKAANNP